MNTYEEVCHFQNLYHSHKAARRGKQSNADVVNFELELGNKLWQLKNALDQQCYLPDSYYTFYIHDPKKRKIDALHYKDRVVQHSLCTHVLAPTFEKDLFMIMQLVEKTKEHILH